MVRQETTQSAGPMLTPPQSPCRLAHLPTVLHGDDTPEDLGVALGGGHVQRGGPRAGLPGVLYPPTVEPLPRVLQQALLFFPPRLVQVDPCGSTWRQVTGPSA